MIVLNEAGDPTALGVSFPRPLIPETGFWPQPALRVFVIIKNEGKNGGKENTISYPELSFDLSPLSRLRRGF